MSTLTYTGSLIITSCWCGIRVAVPSSLYDEAHDSGKSIYCPIGHTFVYRDNNKKKIAQLEARLTNARDQLSASESRNASLERSKSALKGTVTRQKRRAAAGTCPCCKRSFAQVQRHLNSQHPEYVEKQRMKSKRKS